MSLSEEGLIFRLQKILSTKSLFRAFLLKSNSMGSWEIDVISGEVYCRPLPTKLGTGAHLHLHWKQVYTILKKER
jgi:hypothetical protein